MGYKGNSFCNSEKERDLTRNSLWQVILLVISCWFRRSASPRAIWESGQSRVCSRPRHNDTPPHTWSVHRTLQPRAIYTCWTFQRAHSLKTSFFAPPPWSAIWSTWGGVRWLRGWMTSSLRPAHISGWPVQASSRLAVVLGASDCRSRQTCSGEFRPAPDMFHCRRRSGEPTSPSSPAAPVCTLRALRNIEVKRFKTIALLSRVSTYMRMPWVIRYIYKCSHVYTV